MNTERDQAELLDQAINKMLQRGPDGPSATSEPIGDMRGIDPELVVHDLRSVAESTPMRVEFMAELEARLLAVPAPAEDDARNTKQGIDEPRGVVHPEGAPRLARGIKGWWGRYIGWWDARNDAGNAGRERQAGAGSRQAQRTPRGLGLAWAMISFLALAGAAFLLARPQTATTTASQILTRAEQAVSNAGGYGLQYFHHYDGSGDVSAWTNHAGKAVQEYMYAPYGRLIDNNGPDNSSNRTDPYNNLTWSGKP